MIRTVIATAVLGIGVSLVAAPIASAQPTDCGVRPPSGVGTVCTFPDVINSYLSTPNQFVNGWSQQPAKIQQGISYWAAFPGQVVQAWTHPFAPSTSKTK